MKALFLLLFTASALAQNPPTINPLLPPVDPIENQSSPDKIMLGKALYWDEQLSSTKTVACASCHIMSSGGTDPRSNPNNPDAQNPGFDGIFNTEDDITGSPGVADTHISGEYLMHTVFGYFTQVTSRNAPSVINSGYSSTLFWDGRAGDQLIDPLTDEILISSGAALEVQVLGPLLSSKEMAHSGRTWFDVIKTIQQASPLALSPMVPDDLRDWIGTNSYHTLFKLVFGNSEISAAKIAMAIASYERSLFSNQSPFDQSLNGNPNALTQQERRGLGVFTASQCIACHTGALLTDNNFHNIGVSPNFQDVGRFAVTELAADQGRFKTPSLRNLENKTSFMHNGNFSSLETVVDFYDRGGDFNNPNKDPRIRPLNLSQNQKNDLLAFLKRPLSDPRVGEETGPFSSPLLFAESLRVPIISENGIFGTNGKTPVVFANQPGLLGNKNFTIAIENALPAANAIFVMSESDPGIESLPLEQDTMHYVSKTLNISDGDGHTSVSIELPNSDSYDGMTLYGRWYVEDSQAINGYAISPLLELTLFQPNFGTAGQIFVGSFE
ncbi:MAG: cytochrome-c peroxidase [Marinicellaceae bacterium]